MEDRRFALIEEFFLKYATECRDEHEGTNLGLFFSYSSDSAGS